MITHDSDLAKSHAEIVYWLRDGRLEKVTGKKKKSFKKQFLKIKKGKE